MRCFAVFFRPRPRARKSFMMSFVEYVGLGGLLVLAALTGTCSAARSQQERLIPSTNPQLGLPPLVFPDFGQIHHSTDLGERVFTLRHIYHHGGNKYPELHRYVDIDPDVELQVTSDYGATFEPATRSLPVRVVSTNIERMVARKKADIDDLLDHAGYYGQAVPLSASAWTIDEVAGPNVSDKATIVSFARMSANAYVQEHNAHDWQPVGSGFNYTDDFGWEADGLRGHIFADETNGTIVIGLKGTSPAIFDGADTTGNDKLNDNLFGSCCCAQGGQFTWKTVCDCMTSTYTCNSTCLVKSLRQKSHYYWAVRDLYHNVTERYPAAEVWLSGHSLGGVVSSLLGLTYGLPTITFEAFPDALAASRLGLPMPPGYRVGSHQARFDTGIHHIGHTADPIYMGKCNAASSFCSLAGYAFQGLCHTGKTCIYDTVQDLGWRVAIGTHKIVNVINDVLSKYDTVPNCDVDLDCWDCSNWKFFESNGSEPTTSSSTSSSSTRTRTETCRTPGWWGCLDESTTTTATTTSTSSTSSTSTCRTPGWFGCKDPTTTATTTTTTSATTTRTTTSPTTSCKSRGWFGDCQDPTTIAPQPSSTPAMATPSKTLTPIPEPPEDPWNRPKCRSRHWYGLCKEWFHGMEPN